MNLSDIENTEQILCDSTRKNSGEFSLSFDDFCKKMNRLSFVHINLNAYVEQQDASANTSNWNFTKEIYSFKNQNDEWSYPQHILNLSDSPGRAAVLIALMTTDYVEKKQQRKHNSAIGFHLYRVKSEQAKLKAKYSLIELNLCGKTRTYMREREVTKKCFLEPGIYVILLTTAAQIKTDYLLRICKSITT